MVGVCWCCEVGEVNSGAGLGDIPAILANFLEIYQVGAMARRLALDSESRKEGIYRAESQSRISVWRLLMRSSKA